MSSPNPPPAPPDPAAAALAAVHQALVAGDQDRAGLLLGQALVRWRDHAGLLAQSAVLNAMAGQAGAAAALADRALALDPGEPTAAALRARLHLDDCAAVAAETVARTALERAPGAARLRRELAAALLFQGRAVEALTQARQAARSLPDAAEVVGTALLASLYDDTLAPAQRLALHRELAAGLAPARCPQPLSPANEAVLRVGFYSPDFRNHPVGHLVAPVLEQLDGSRFRAFCYAELGQRDALTAALQALPHAWREVTGRSDDQVLALMRSDRLDVLVDLAGHSHGGRPRVLRGRAAPVQLDWLGYPFSLGLPELDGLVGDDIVLPPGAEEDHGRPLLRLPLGVFCLQAPEGLPPVAPPPMTARGAPTLGSFNHLAKLSDATVDLWSRLLRARPDARLVLCAIPLLEAATRQRVLARFVDQGVDPGRIELRPPRPPGPDFLRQYDDIDLALDPLPFSGGATTLDALRQGVPVLTLPGASFASRMSASLLSRIGLPEFVAADADDWLARALSWLADPGALAGVRAGLRRRLAAAPAADGERYTRSFERLLLGAAGRGP